jgi:hypothetical protein|tara:strand:- start:463 stop:594 length:132 start_codon:yes stop_codon:yes gene_type:complete
LVKDGKLFGGGKIKPKCYKNTYEVIFVFNPNKKGRKENIYIKS